MEMLEHPKKKTKIWEAISVDLQENFGLQMSVDQVRWKMNALTKKYKECVDNNSKSGRSLMTFEWFEQMDEIFGQQRNAVAKHTVSSNFSYLISKSPTSSTERFDSKSSTSLTERCDSRSSTSTCSTMSVSNNANILVENNLNENIQTSNDSSKTNKRKRPLHGSGSNLARSKVELENQWLDYMKMKTERDKVNEEKCAAALEQKKEALKLKKKHFALKEKEIEQRKEYFTAKLREKENRNAQLISIEKEKCKLLKKLLKNETSDSE